MSDDRGVDDNNATYFGYLVPRTDYEQEPCRIRVEAPGFLVGRPKVLRRLERDENDPFNWGHHGSSSIATAEAVLADALCEPVSLHHEPHKRVVVAFSRDIVAHLPREQSWTLSRDAVLAWVRGWYVATAPHMMPRAVKRIGDVDGAVESPLRDWE